MKVFYYIVIIMGMILLLEYGGINTGNSGLTDLIGFATGQLDVTTSSFFNALFDVNIGFLFAGIGASIVVGLFAKGRLENFILLPFITGSLIFFVSAMQSIVTYAEGAHSGWVSKLAVLILGALIIGLIISLAEWFRGSD